MIRVAGHFGELLQGRLGSEGPVVLISLPCPVLAVSVEQVAGGAGLRLHSPGTPMLSPSRALRLLTRLGLRLSGRVVLQAQMPVGGGAGASTAALVALARLAGWRGSAMDLAQACVAVEGATDPLMLPQAERLLWASRRAELLDHLPPVPDFDLLGGFCGPALRTDPADSDFANVSDLIAQWQRAGSLGQMAEIATESARRTLARRGPQGDPALALAQDLGAMGVVIGHTGSARGLIFAPGQVPDTAAPRLHRAGLRRMIRLRHRSAA